MIQRIFSTQSGHTSPEFFNQKSVFSTMRKMPKELDPHVLTETDPKPPAGKPVPSQLPPAQESEKFDLSFLNEESQKFLNATQIIVERVVEALEQQRHRDLERLRKHTEMFTQVNIKCRAVREFVSELLNESNQFRCTIDHEDESRQLWVRFTLSFGEGKYQRRFPICVIYQREPQLATLVKIDLFEIGKTHQTRIGHMEQLNIGWLEHQFGYFVTMPRSITEGTHIVKWLKHAFTRIFPAAYQE